MRARLTEVVHAAEERLGSILADHRAAFHEVEALELELKQAHAPPGTRGSRPDVWVHAGRDARLYPRCAEFAPQRKSSSIWVMRFSHHTPARGHQHLASTGPPTRDLQCVCRWHL
eukprot:5543789-Prymnesium_polylepis.5